jgi:hypothetical protein
MASSASIAEKTMTASSINVISQSIFESSSVTFIIDTTAYRTVDIN